MSAFINGHNNTILLLTDVYDCVERTKIAAIVAPVVIGVCFIAIIVTVIIVILVLAIRQRKKSEVDIRSSAKISI